VVASSPISSGRESEVGFAPIVIKIDHPFSSLLIDYQWQVKSYVSFVNVY
jgi:hypothetical protein